MLSDQRCDFEQVTTVCQQPESAGFWNNFARRKQLLTQGWNYICITTFNQDGSLPFLRHGYNHFFLTTSQKSGTHGQHFPEISNAACELPPTVLEFQSQEYDDRERQVKWHIKKFKGLCEYSARFRFIFDHGMPIAAEKLLGPISLKFNIIGFVASSLSIQRLDVSTSGSSKPPKKWLRETTVSGDYTYELI